MTSVEMVQGFISELHEYDGSLDPDTDDIFYYINKAQNSFVQERFDKAFEGNQALTDDLQALIETDKELEAVYAGANSEISGKFADYSFLPEDYLHYIDHRLKIFYERGGLATSTTSVTIDGSSYTKRTDDSGGSGTTKFVRGEMAKSDILVPKLNDPFNTTFDYSPLSFLNNGRLTTYTNSEFIIDKTLLTYLREPVDVDFDTDSDIPAAYHEEIVEMAVMNMLQFAGSSRGKQSQQQQS